MKSLVTYLTESQNFLVNQHTSVKENELKLSKFLTWYVKDNLSNINIDKSFSNVLDLNKTQVRKLFDMTILKCQYVTLNKYMLAPFRSFSEFYKFLLDNRDSKLENFTTKENNKIYSIEFNIGEHKFRFLTKEKYIA